MCKCTPEIRTPWCGKPGCEDKWSNDHVNHPSHYNSGKIEAIEAIEDWKLGFHLGNAVKYIARAGKKHPDKTIEDLEKAIWYIRREIETHKENPDASNEMPQERAARDRP
jgi:hypothetical protein